MRLHRNKRRRKKAAWTHKFVKLITGEIGKLKYVNLYHRFKY